MTHRNALEEAFWNATATQVGEIIDRLFPRMRRHEGMPEAVCRKALEMMRRDSELRLQPERAVRGAARTVFRHSALQSDRLLDELAALYGEARVPEAVYRVVNSHLKKVSRELITALAA